MPSLPVAHTRNNIWLGLIVVCLSFLYFLLPQLYRERSTPVGAAGVTHTICASGCDFTTIGAAFMSGGVTSGDTIQVGATYAKAGETFPLSAHPSKTALTIDCQSSGAEIGTSTPDTIVVFGLNEDFVVQNCLFTGVNLTGTSVDNLTIDNNGGSGNVVTLNKGTSHAVTDNSGLKKITIHGANNSEVSGNSITVTDADSEAAVWIAPYSGDGTLATGITVTNNTIIGNSVDTTLNLIDVLGGSGHVMATNTLRFAAAPSSNSSAIIVYDATSTLMSGNTIDFSSVGGGRAGIFVVANDSEAAVTIRHNTIKHDADKPYIMFMDAHSWDPEVNNGTAQDITATVEYNILYNAESGATGEGIQIVKSGTGSTLNISNDYNGFYNLATTISTGGFDADSIDASVGANTKTSNPYFKTDDADAGNNFELAPFSSYLDVNGTLDIGAYSAARGDTFSIDDTGVVDYDTVHATTTAIISVARSDDTFTLAAGTYDAFTVSSTSGALTGLMINGAGASTIINAGAGANAVLLNSVQSSIVQNMTVQNASSTESSYTLTKALYAYNGSNYDDSENLGSAPNTMFIFRSAEECTMGAIADEPTDITDDIGDATNNWHLAFLDAGGAKGAAWVPGNLYSDAAGIELICGGFGVSVDLFISNVFTVTGGNYTYNASTVTTAGASMMDGYTNPPVLSRLSSSYAGIKFAGASSGNSIENITSSENGYGFWFADTANVNNVVSSVIENSVLNDMYSSTTGTNSFYNVSHDVTTNSITGDGAVNGYYTARWLVQNDEEGGIEGVTVTYAAANAESGTNLVTDEDGYTDYTDWIQAFRLDSENPNTSTAGGYNPYTVSVEASELYDAFSADQSVDEPNQTLTVTLASASVAPSAPENLALSAITATGVTISWDDVDDNDGYYIDVAEGDDDSVFPSGAQYDSDTPDLIGVDWVGLTPNTEYIVRVGPYNDAGATYVTSSAFYTLAAVPTGATASASGQTSMIVSWGANSNPSGTVYEVYNNTVSALVATTTATAYTVTGLTAGTSYQFKVRAENVGNPTTWSSYSSLSSAVSTAAASSGGGGFSVTPAAPVAPEQGVEFTINSQAFSTDSIDVTLSINSPTAALMAVSNSPTFEGASYEPYLSTKAWKLSTGVGMKTVYVKLRTAQGGEKVVNDSIEFVASAVVKDPTEEKPVSCPLAPTFAYKSLSSPSVYYVTKDCTKRAFTSPAMFFSYFTSWSDVRLTNNTLLSTVPNDALRFMPWGPLYDPQYGALVKIVSDPNVYLLLGEKRYWIKTETVFNALGYSWSWIEDISDDLLAKYDVGEEITATDRHPNYTLVKYSNSPKVYRLEPSATDASVSVKRHVADEDAFKTLGFRWDRIVVISDSEIYADGAALTGN